MVIFMIVFIVVVILMPPIIAGFVASISFDVALRYGLFGRTADDTPPRVRKLYLMTVPIGVLAAYLALVAPTFIPSVDRLSTTVSVVFAILIVLAIKFAFLLCAIRRAHRASREPADNETHESTNAASIEPAPTA